MYVKKMGIYKHFQGKTKFAIILYFEKLLQYNAVKKTVMNIFAGTIRFFNL